MLHERRPVRSRAVELMLMQLCLFRGEGFVPMQTICAVCRVRDRHALARELCREGLPRYSAVAPWIRVLLFSLQWETNGATPGGLMLRHGLDAAPVYRMIARVTGLSWLEVRELGSALVLELVVADWKPVATPGHDSTLDSKSPQSAPPRVPGQPARLAGSTLCA